MHQICLKQLFFLTVTVFTKIFADIFGAVLSFYKHSIEILHIQIEY